MLHPWVHVIFAPGAGGVYSGFTVCTPSGIQYGDRPIDAPGVAAEFALTTNRCCAFSVGNHDGTKEKGYFLVKVADGALKREFQRMN